MHKQEQPSSYTRPNIGSNPINNSKTTKTPPKVVGEHSRPGMQTMGALNPSKQSDPCKQSHPSQYSLTPLKTHNMRIQPLSIGNIKYRIDREGLTRETTGEDKVHRLINISCNGKLIRMRKG